MICIGKILRDTCAYNNEPLSDCGLKIALQDHAQRTLQCQLHQPLEDCKAGRVKNNVKALHVPLQCLQIMGAGEDRTCLL